jgi:hypothetical protein
LIVSISLNSIGQDLTKKEKKLKKANEKEEILKMYYALIKSKEFVIEVNQIILDDGSIILVNSNVNFFLINIKESNIQIAYNLPLTGGSRDMGVTYFGDKNGISYEGIVDKYKLMEFDSKKPIRLTGSIIPLTGGNLNYSLSCNSSGIANVILRTQRSSQLVFEGKLYSLSDSSVYNRRRGEEDGE